MYEPYYYEKINAEISEFTPNTINEYNNYSFRFWSRSLFHRVMSKLGFDNLPEEWKSQIGSIDFLKYCLLQFGFTAVSEDNKRGLWHNPAKLSGYNFNYQPVYASVANHNFTHGTKKLEIGKDCEILKLTPDYMGIGDIVSYYAEKLALLDCSVNTSLINSKVPYIVGGKTKSAVQALKKIIDKSNAGETAIYYDTRLEDSGSLEAKDTPFHQVKLFTSSDYITDLLLEDRAKLLNAFDAEIGIQTAPYEKKERMVSSEAESKKEDCRARSDTWEQSVNDSLYIINKHYGTSITFEWKGDEDNGSEDNTNRNGNISE